ncbi:oligosaccharide repeat unit polymerase [Lysinibacillus yapensis]|uniref:Oligosaccharide repeat unit polymerase n=1 Tax=Ureibacillus yapensis TaxID=2304605 RepID=A0A396SH04_9BACL|nr:oligosaccharide repeat unit polymerase [Lysinibacillus yapensis]RHW39558.1 oligosaccharide repeat unit polymerase [Lysinibacillus yapensis]
MMRSNHIHSNLLNTDINYFYQRVISFVVVCLLLNIDIMYIYDFELSYITLMFMILVPIIIVPLFFSRDLMHPFNIIFMSSQFLFVYNMIDLNANKGYLRYGSLPSDYYNTAFAFAILVIIIWYLSMYLGYFYASNQRSSKNLDMRMVELNNPKLIAFMLFLITIIGFIFTIYLKGGISGMILALSGRTEAYSGLHYMIKIVGLGAISALILLGCGYKKLSFILIILTFILLSLFGGRGAAFFGSIFPYFVYYHYRINKIKFIHLIPIGIIAIFFGIALGNYRLYQEARISIGGIHDILSKIAHSTQGGEILPSLIGSLINGNIDYARGSTLINIIYAPIPSSLWANKPLIDESGIVGHALMGSSVWGLPPRPYGLAFFNFGFIGVLIIGCLTGIIIYKMYQTFVIKNNNTSRYNVGLIFYVLTIIAFYNVVATSAQIDIIWNIGVFIFIKILDQFFCILGWGKKKVV